MDQLGNFYVKEHNKNKGALHDRYKEFNLATKNIEKVLIDEYGKGLHILCVPERLHSALTSYFYDICRYKHFHGMLDKDKEAKINFPKVYAYTLKWIIKEKPFSLIINDAILEAFKENDPEKFKKLLETSNRINEILAFFWMDISHKSQTGALLDFNAKEKKSLIYNLKFRDIHVGMLESLLHNKIDHEVLKQL